MSIAGAFQSRLNAMQSPLQQRLEDIEKKAEEARAANTKRYEQALAIYDEIINRYKPGGAFEQAGLADIERRKTTSVGRQALSSIGRGLFNVQGGGIGEIAQRYETEVAGGERLKLEDLLMERLSSAQIGKAGLMERVTDEYPDLGQVANLAAGAGSGGHTRTINFGDRVGSGSKHADFYRNKRDLDQGTGEGSSGGPTRGLAALPQGGGGGSGGPIQGYGPRYGSGDEVKGDLPGVDPNLRDTNGMNYYDYVAHVSKQPTGNPLSYNQWAGFVKKGRGGGSSPSSNRKATTSSLRPAGPGGNPYAGQ